MSRSGNPARGYLVNNVRHYLQLRFLIPFCMKCSNQLSLIASYSRRPVNSVRSCITHHPPLPPLRHLPHSYFAATNIPTKHKKLVPLSMPPTPGHDFLRWDFSCIPESSHPTEQPFCSFPNQPESPPLPPSLASTGRTGRWLGKHCDARLPFSQASSYETLSSVVSNGWRYRRQYYWYRETLFD
jgi:hypothetical protein